ncbi:MAG: DUF58 domain-containing protein [Fimbriimonadaceae bacterium]|nr:DUF58 domain-containing protein [Fimbriimonadaceae bacterium]
MRKRKTWYLALSSLCFYVVAAANDRPALYAIFGLTASLWLVSRVQAQLGAIGLRARRAALPARLTAGDAWPLDYTLRNLGAWAKANLELVDQVNHGRQPSIRRQVLVRRLAGGQTLAVTPPRLLAQRGRARLGPLTATASDPLGLFELTRVLDRSVREVLVHPRAVPLPHFYGDGAWGGQATQAARASQGLDFRGLRDYAPGDDLRHLDWKATARTTRLQIREYDRPAAQTATVALDLAATTHWGSGPQGSLETCLSAAASVLLRLQQLGFRSRLLAHDQGPLQEVLAPGQSSWPLLDTLAQADGAGTVALVDLLEGQPELVDERLLVVVTAAGDGPLAAWLGRHRGAGRLEALVVLVTPPGSAPAELARTLAGSAVGVVAVRPGDDLGALLRYHGKGRR